MDPRAMDVVRRLNPIDDIMFRKMAESKGFCEEVLRAILGDEELVIEEAVIPQSSITNLQGRSVVPDAFCTTGSGMRVNIEVQKADDDDHQRRVRYHASLITANIADPGTQFGAVPDVCVVYIARFDVFKGDLPIYHVDRKVRETGTRKYNGLSEVYVNGACRDGSAISRLMRIFMEDDAYDRDEFPRVSQRKWLFKESEEGRAIMCELVEAYAREVAENARREGIEQGIDRGRRQTMQRLVSEGAIAAAYAAETLGIDERAFIEEMEATGLAAQN